MKKHGNSCKRLWSMPDMSNETLARALGEIVRDFDRQLERHLEGVRMQASAMVAEAHAKVAEAEARREGLLNDLVAKVHERLETLKDGTDGSDGKDGVDGINGTDGINGADGVNGIDGKDGADGKDGQDGKSVSLLGTFDADHEYSELDVVILGGSSFIARKDAPGPCPGGGWQLLASRGSRGEKGDRGERGFDGDKGERGERGATGDTPAAFYADGNELVITMSSGTELRCGLPMVRK